MAELPARPEASSGPGGSTDPARVLFVDDDPALLAGLRRMLRARRVPGELFFAASAEEAIGRLGELRPDGVVTDMRMPGVDGAALLEVVRREVPGALRVILSGQTERVAAVRAIGVAHRFLGKPTDPEVLVATVAAAGRLAHGPLPASVRGRLGGLACLPASPGTLELLDAALAGPSPAPAALTRAATDLAVTAKLTQLASSPFLAPPALPRSDAELAGHLQGPDLALVLAAGVLATAAPSDELATLAEALRARAGRLVARAEALHGGPLPPAARLGARLRDLGWLLAAELGVEARLDEVAPGDAQAGARGLAAHLLATWGLPDELVAVVAAPRPATIPPEPGPLPALDAVVTADALEPDGVAADSFLPPVAGVGK